MRKRATRSTSLPRTGTATTTRARATCRCTSTCAGARWSRRTKRTKSSDHDFLDRLSDGFRRVVDGAEISKIFDQVNQVIGDSLSEMPFGGGERATAPPPV